MRLSAILIMIFCLLLAAGPRVSAQISLPPVQLPRIPELSRIGEPPLIDLDRTLDRLRLDRVDALLRAHPEIVELDRNDRPAVRGILFAIGVDAAMVARAAEEGFALESRERIEGLDLDVARFRVPGDRSLARAQKQLARLLPGAQVDADNLYFASGSESAAADGTMRAAPLASAARSGVSLGLIDGGVAAHPSVAGRVEQRGFARGAPSPSRHGTAVASLLIGEGTVRGAAPGARLLAADVYGADPAGGNASAITRALGWLVQRGAAVVTISLVGPDNKLLALAVQRAQARGLLIVAAVGNDGPAAPPAYPAAYPGVLGVTGVDAKGEVLPEAGRAAQVDFAGPGEAVLAATGAASSERLRGTSFAAPLVAGRLARLYPAPNVDRIEPAIRALIAEARDLGRKGRDKQTGYGLVCGDCGR
ncbi:S8 family serine peptidase [Sphingopyxis flava]|uniref:Subtilase family protein n=1 Tax=Sphingopyxis flava TaxID=1507287 RepID=A0A1T5CL06_9SPHN|nr:S8 family serine peptidase [Sphingopyxis flava]SKB60129.1 Subtilase family protein [Sphingopyxis flava]